MFKANFFCPDSLSVTREETLSQVVEVQFFPQHNSIDHPFDDFSFA